MHGTVNATSVRDVGPKEAWSALASRPDAVLVDVRTAAEWTFVGVPRLESLSKKPILLEWQTFPSMSMNPSFVTSLKGALTEAGLGQEVELYFLCRSGVRSKAAAEAMIEAGWVNSFNIAGGFEGAPDPSGKRGTVNGWKASSLPWSQT